MDLINKTMKDALIYGNEYAIWRNGQFLGFAKWEQDEHNGDRFISTQQLEGATVKKLFFNIDEWKLNISHAIHTRN